MLMSHMAMMDLGARQDTLLARIRGAVARFFGFGDVPPELADVLRPEPRAVAPATRAVTPLRVHVVSDVAATTNSESLRWRRHPQLRDRPTSALPANEREARGQAVRGLYAARAGDLEAARHFFSLAATEHAVDLCQIPGFWNLPRAAMLAAVAAYEDAGRVREASALGARIRTMFRPRALTPVPENVTELPVRKLSVSSGS
jgi:hypothetical protein